MTEIQEVPAEATEPPEERKPRRFPTAFRCSPRCCSSCGACRS